MQAVGSIREWTRWPYRILIRDHASDEHHRAHIRELQPETSAGSDMETEWCDKFWSCNEGRRYGLDLIETEYTVFMDDDERVSPLWLTNMMSVMLSRPNCGAVVANMIQERGQDRISGGRAFAGEYDVTALPYGSWGRVEFCAGGCTLYRTDALRATEFRPEYNAGYEDWDQTLQMTRELGMDIFTSRAVFFHTHQRDMVDYVVDRWRMTELMDAAIAIWRRWRIRTGVRVVARAMIKMNARMQDEQWDVYREVMSL